MKKYHYYVDPDGHITGPTESALSVKGDANVEALVFVFPADFGLDASSSVLRVYYDPPGHRGSSLYQTLNPAAVGPDGIQTAEWPIDSIHTTMSGRVSFSLAVIAEGATRWVSRKAWVPVADSHYYGDSQEQEEAYTSRLETAEAAIAAMRTGKQDVLTFDAAPTEGSTNPVTSGGVYTVEKAATDLLMDIIQTMINNYSTLTEFTDATHTSVRTEALDSNRLAIDIAEYVGKESIAYRGYDIINYLTDRIKEGADYITCARALSVEDVNGEGDALVIGNIALRRVQTTWTSRIYVYIKDGDTWAEADAEAAHAHLTANSWTIYVEMEV